jgi:hypothetical protein
MSRSPLWPRLITDAKSRWKKKPPNPKKARTSRLSALTRTFSHFLRARPLGMPQHLQELTRMQTNPPAPELPTLTTLITHLRACCESPALGKASAPSGTHTNAENPPARELPTLTTLITHLFAFCESPQQRQDDGITLQRQPDDTGSSDGLMPPLFTAPQEQLGLNGIQQEPDWSDRDRPHREPSANEACVRNRTPCSTPDKAIKQQI